MIRNEHCLTFLLGKAYQHAHQAAKLRLAPYGVTPGQFALLNVLWVEDGLSGAELGARLQLDSATMTGLIDRLANMGLVERRPDPSDRRVNRVYLTESGATIWSPVSREFERYNDELFKQFEPEEAKRLHAMLSRLAGVAVEKALS